MCGFVWETVCREEIGGRVRQGSLEIVDELLADPVGSTRRPSERRWSSLEYGAHVRDVLLHLRDRFVIGLVEDHAAFKPLYRDERVDLGLYGGDEVIVVADELAMSAALFERTFNRIPAKLLDRLCVYTFPVLTDRTLLWMGQQAVHEVEHHARDVAENSATAH